MLNHIDKDWELDGEEYTEQRVCVYGLSGAYSLLL